MCLSCGSELWKLNSNLNVKIKCSTIDKILLEGGVGWFLTIFFFPLFNWASQNALGVSTIKYYKYIPLCYQHSSAPRTNHTTNHLSYARKSSHCRQLQRAEILFNFKCISYVVVLCSTVYTYLQSSVKEDSAKTTSALTQYSAQNN